MKARPVKMAPGAKFATSETPTDFGPQMISIHGEPFWMCAATGAAVSSVTAIGVDDYTQGAVSILLYQRAFGKLSQGLSLLRSFQPDEADEFADQLKEVAATIREAAARRATDALRKAAGK